MHSVLKITALDINKLLIQSNILMANQFDIEIFPRIYLLKVKIGQLGYFVHIYLPLLISILFEVHIPFVAENKYLI